MNYYVDFAVEGEVKTEVFQDCYDIGQAYRKCLKKYPEATLMAGHCYRKWAGGELWMNYEPVSTKKPEPLPYEKRVQNEMELNDARKEKSKRNRSR